MSLPDTTPPVVETAEATPPVVETAEAAPPVVPPVVEAVKPPEAVPAPDARIAALESQLANLRRTALQGMLSAVAPDLRDMAATAIGDVDVSTPLGRAAVQKWLETHPSAVARDAVPNAGAPQFSAAEIAKYRQSNPLGNINFWKGKGK